MRGLRKKTAIALVWAACALGFQLTYAPVQAASTAPSSTSQVESYDAKFFEDQHPDTAYDMIRLLPAFDFDSGSSVRGFAAAAGNVLIDGQLPTSKEDSLIDILTRIPASSISRIDVIRGGAPGIDMHGHTVVANIIEKPAVTTGTLNTDVAFLTNGRIGNTARVDYAHRAGASSLEGSLSLFHHDGAPDGDGEGSKILRDNAGGAVSKTHVRIVNPNTGLTANGQIQKPALDGLLHIKGSITVGDNKSVESDAILAPPPPRDDTVHFLFRTHLGELGADYSRSFANGIRLKVIALQDLEKFAIKSFALQDGILTKNDDDSLRGESIFRATVRREFGSTLILEGGGEADYNFLNANSSLTVDGVPIALPSTDVHVAEVREEPFSTLNWKPVPHLSIDLGAKFELSRLSVSGDANHAVSFKFLKPRLFVAWDFDSRDQLRLRVERTVGQLDFQQFVTSAALDTGVISAGNPELVPERDWSFEGALEHKFWSSGAVTVTLRHQSLQKVVDEKPIGAFTAAGNIGSGYRNTLAVDFNVPLAKLGMRRGIVKGTLNWLTSSVTDPTTLVRRTITNDKPFISQVRLSNDVPRLKSTWRLTVTGGSTYSIFQVNEIQRFASHTQVDFQWEYKPNSKWSLIAQAQDISTKDRNRRREIFGGARNVNPLLFMEDRVLTNPFRLVLAIRRNL